MNDLGLPLVIVGAGGFGREAADVACAMTNSDNSSVWNLIGVYDDYPSKPNLMRLEERRIPYLGPLPVERHRSTISYVVGIGAQK